MNRENLLYLLIGMLGGFIVGYLLHETMAARQPPRLPLGGVPSAAMPGAGMPAAGAPAGGPAVAEVAQLKAYVEQNPNDADAVLALANMNFDVRNWGAARDLYLRRIQLAGEHPDVLTDLGVSFRELGEHQKAIEHFEKAKSLDPKHWQSRYNELIVLVFDLQQYDRADTILAELKALQPANPDIARLEEEIRRRRGA